MSSVENSNARVHFSFRAFCEKHSTEIVISLLVLGIIVGIILTATSVTGGLSITGMHWKMLSPLTTAISSIWQGLPYSMTAMAVPAMLAFLEGLVAGVILYIKRFDARNAHKNGGDASFFRERVIYDDLYITHKGSEIEYVNKRCFIKWVGIIPLIVFQKNNKNSSTSTRHNIKTNHHTKHVKRSGTTIITYYP